MTASIGIFYKNNVIHVNEIWVDQVMACVTTMQYHVLLNYSDIGCVSPSRGLRQGDPLSPLLFIICAEYFSASLRHKETTGFI